MWVWLFFSSPQTFLGGDFGTTAERNPALKPQSRASGSSRARRRVPEPHSGVADRPAAHHPMSGAHTPTFMQLLISV